MRGRPMQLELSSHHTFGHRNSLSMSYILDFFVSFLSETKSGHFILAGIGKGVGGGEWVV